jgi:hypothetical protein
MLLNVYKILSKILLSRLNPYADKIIGDHQCGFQHNRSTNDQIFLDLLDPGERMRVQQDSMSAIHELKKAYDPVRSEVLNNILTKSGMRKKVASLNQMCLYDIYGKVHISKHLSDMFPLHKGLKQENVSL